MTGQRRVKAFWADTRWFPVVGVLFTLAVLAATIFLGRDYLQKRISEQIAGRDARVLHAVWLLQLKLDRDDEIGLSNESPADHFVTVLEASQLRQLKELRAARLFDSEGELVITLPPYVTDDQLSRADFEALKELKPISRFRAKVDWNEILGLPSLYPVDGSLIERSHGPMSEVILPINSPGDSKVHGAVQFLLDGSSLGAEFEALSRSLWLQAILAFAVAGGTIVAGLTLAFRRLQSVNRLLTERTQRLLQANQELALAAKTSAVGAVTSHLIHGLKNPLSGLQSFISNRGGNRTGEDGDQDWEIAISTTRRMQNLVSEIVRVLREEQSGSQYEISLDELIEMIAAKMRPTAEQAGVRFLTRLSAKGTLSNRDANLILLIMDNLLQNAVQATPRGRTVSVHIHDTGEATLCEVHDQGPGLPERYREQLFMPCQSTKDKGAGIGLAISKQLANYLGASLDLQRSSTDGCVFALSLPRGVFMTGQNRGVQQPR